MKTNFDRYLKEQLKDPASARFERAGEAWGAALQIAALRRESGLSRKDLAKLLNVSQQQISCLESPGCDGRSLSALRNVAKVLRARPAKKVDDSSRKHKQSPERFVAFMRRSSRCGLKVGRKRKQTHTPEIPIE